MIERDLDIEGLASLARREGNSKKPVYEMHKWWARRLSVNFRMFLICATSEPTDSLEESWKKFYSPYSIEGKRVMDPFMGGGTSVVEAMKLGAIALGCDIDPIAWFVTKKETDPWDASVFQEELDALEHRVAERVRAYYRTDIDGAGADVVYYFWVSTARCTSCNRDFEAHINYILYDDRRKTVRPHRLAFCRKCGELHPLRANQRRFVCESCGTKTDCFDAPMKNGNYRCPHCSHKEALADAVRKGMPLGRRLFAVEYVDPTDKKNKFKKADKQDRLLFEKASDDLGKLLDKLPIPKDSTIPVKNRTDLRPITFGMKKYVDMFNQRQLLCLGLILNEINKVEDDNTREYMLLAFSDCLACNNMLAYYAFGYRKLTPLFGLHSYRMVTRPVEGNVWGTSSGRGSYSASVRKIQRGKAYFADPWEYLYGDKREPGRVPVGQKKEYHNPPTNSTTPRLAVLRNSDARNLNWIEDSYVDIVLTDPPYYDNIPYSELSDFYYIWIRDYVEWPSAKRKAHTPMDLNLIVNARASKSRSDFTEGLTKSFRECKRILKPDGLLIFTFHHKRAEAWHALARTLRDSGFTVTNVFPVLSEGKSGFHSSAGNLKWDIVFTCRARDEERLGRYSDSRRRKSVEKQKEYWRRRLSEGGIEVGDLDRQSLEHGLNIAYIVNRPHSMEDLESLFTMENRK